MAYNSALSQVNGTTTPSTQLVAARGNRKSLIVYNDSTATLYLAFGASATTSAYSVKIPGGYLYESPASASWTGKVTGVWDSATGTAQITEIY